MPKITNPVVEQKILASLLAGNSDKQAALDGGLSPNSAINASRVHVVKCCKAQAAQVLSDSDIIDSLKEILKLKLSVEKKLFRFIDSHPEIDASNLKTVTLAINKTKDNIAEITKTLRLVSGDTTEKIEVDAGRQARLLSMLSRVRQDNILGL